MKWKFCFNYLCCHSTLRLQGILLKGAQVLDALASCRAIAFDKTGTLTTGGLMFKAIEPIYGHWIRSSKKDLVSCCIPTCEKEALAVAAAMEKGTTHPIGRYFTDSYMRFLCHFYQYDLIPYSLD